MATATEKKKCEKCGSAAARMGISQSGATLAELIGKADKAADARPGIATLTRDLRFVNFRSSHSVTVQIDLGAVMAYLGRKAAFSPKRRTSALDGAIVVTSIRRSEEREIRPHAGAIEPVTTAGPCYCQDCEAARKAKAVRS